MKDDNTTLKKPAKDTGAGVDASEAQPNVPLQKKKGNKKLVAGGIIAAALLLLGGGGALAYNLWYQNPDKIVHDAVINAVQADSMKAVGELAVNTEQGKVNMSFDSAGAGMDGRMAVKASVDFDGMMNFDVEGEGIMKEDMAYVRLAGVQDAVDEFLAQMPFFPPEMVQQIEEVVAKIDNTWMSVSLNDFELSEEDAEVQQCMIDAFRKLNDDRGMRNEIIDIYKEHQFFIIEEELGVEDGSFGFVVDVDSDKAKNFGDAIADTEFANTVKDCDPATSEELSEEIDRETERNNDEAAPRVEMWVSRFGHDLTKLTVEYEENGTTVDFSVEPEFNVNVSVDAPEDATPIQEVMDEVNELVESFAPTTPVAPVPPAATMPQL